MYGVNFISGINVSCNNPEKGCTEKFRSDYSDCLRYD